MIWIALAVLALIALAPLAFSVRHEARARGRREAAMDLHRAQLAELDRDRDEGRIGQAEHAVARLEVQRRLLAAADDADRDGTSSSRRPILIALGIVPVAAFALYLAGGSPELPGAPLARRIAEMRARTAEEDKLIDQLRHALVTMDPRSERARAGYVLLGNVQASRGDLAGAASAWQAALTARFDPTLAVETAEAMTEANGGQVGPDATALFRRALAEAPPNAPWRPMAEKRLAAGK